MGTSVAHWMATNLVRVFKAALVAGAVSSLVTAVLSPRASEFISWTYQLASWVLVVMALAMVVVWLIRRVSGVELKSRTASELAAALPSLSISEKLQTLLGLVAGWLAFYAIGWISGVIAVLLFSWARQAG